MKSDHKSRSLTLNHMQILFLVKSRQRIDIRPAQIIFAKMPQTLRGTLGKKMSFYQFLLISDHL